MPNHVNHRLIYIIAPYFTYLYACYIVDEIMTNPQGSESVIQYYLVFHMLDLHFKRTYLLPAKIACEHVDAYVIFVFTIWR